MQGRDARDQGKIQLHIRMKSVFFSTAVAAVSGVLAWYLTPGEEPRVKVEAAVGTLLMTYLCAWFFSRYYLLQAWRCEACHTLYSIREIGRHETLLSNDVSTSQGAALAKSSSGGKVRYSVTYRYCCAVCGDEFQDKTIETRKILP